MEKKGSPLTQDSKEGDVRGKEGTPMGTRFKGVRCEMEKIGCPWTQDSEKGDVRWKRREAH